MIKNWTRCKFCGAVITYYDNGRFSPVICAEVTGHKCSVQKRYEAQYLHEQEMLRESFDGQ